MAIRMNERCDLEKKQVKRETKNMIICNLLNYSLEIKLKLINDLINYKEKKLLIFNLTFFL